VLIETLNPTHSLTLSIIDEQTDGRTEGQKGYSKHPRQFCCRVKIEMMSVRKCGALQRRRRRDIANVVTNLRLFEIERIAAKQAEPETRQKASHLFFCCISKAAHGFPHYLVILQ